jgi:hypothetical protein
MKNKTVTISTHPLRYGNENVTEAFETNKIGFELEVRTETYRHSDILDLETVLNLKNQIENALKSYDEFMNRSSFQP